MKEFDSGRPETPPNSQETNSQVGSRGVGSWALIVAVAYFAAHLPSLAPSLEDIDSINFALGLRAFDPARPQPHPPGSPVYIALGRGLLAIVSALFSMLSQISAEA